MLAQRDTVSIIELTQSSTLLGYLGKKTQTITFGRFQHTFFVGFIIFGLLFGDTRLIGDDDSSVRLFVFTRLPVLGHLFNYVTVSIIYNEIDKYSSYINFVIIKM